ncbi:hypothetical protein FMZ60_08570 [Alcaligenaceae bacterium SJ-26]|nr:hypothetical protein FMZ60_08570 [Alcaligenaceae bacterium SJ-26]
MPEIHQRPTDTPSLQVRIWAAYRWDLTMRLSRANTPDQVRTTEEFCEGYKFCIEQLAEIFRAEIEDIDQGLDDLRKHDQAVG